MSTIAETRVAGIGVDVTSMADADRLGGLLVDAARAQGVSVSGLVVGLHRVLDTDPRGGGHLAFSLRADALDETGLWDLTREAAARLGMDGAGEQRVGASLGRRSSGDPRLVEAATLAAREQGAASSGRAVAFPGGESLIGVTQVDAIVATSAIDDVVDLVGDVPPTPGDLVLVGVPLRPRWQFGSLVLHVLPAPGAGDGAVYVPFDAAARVGA